MASPRVALATADPAELVARTVSLLQRGGLCLLPTETVYGLALLPGQPAAEARARALLARPAPAPFTWHLAEAAGAAALDANPPAALQPLLQRFWPGPLTLVLPHAQLGSIGLRVPANEFTRAVLRAVGQPLWLASCRQTRAGLLPPGDPSALLQALGQDLDLAIDAGPAPLGTESTVLAIEGPRLAIRREGILTATEVLTAAALQILFVCTGNTCRSPLATAQAMDLAARSLGAQPTGLLHHRLHFASAGTATLGGLPASEGSLLAGRELGLDLGDHHSQQLDRELIARADRIYCLARSHQRAVLDLQPAAASKVALLRPDGRDIADPYGGDLQAYRATAREIRAAIGKRLPDWLAAAKLA
jgi:L-threonylcarbamoyladenylate synthase